MLLPAIVNRLEYVVLCDCNMINIITSIIVLFT